MEMSKLRVAERVAHGGHNIPTKDIERRFARSLRNLLNDFSYRVERTRCFMNSDIAEPIFEQQGSQRIILNEVYYQQILKEADS